MIILDTNVISGLMQAVPDSVVVDWLDRQPPESIWTTSISVFEVVYGLQCLPKGRRRNALTEAFEKAVKEDLEGRVLDLDSFAAHEAAAIAASLRSKGRPVEVRDALICGIVNARKGTLATRNTKLFVNAGIQVVNPWETNL